MNQPFFIAKYPINSPIISKELIVLLDKKQLDFTIRRLAHQLVEEDEDPRQLLFVGLQPRGLAISNPIIENIRQIVPGKQIRYGLLDITFYRDDIRTELHKASKTDMPFSTEGQKVILIDDVLHTGRTIRAALDALNDFGRPAQVKLCVLVNRRFSRQLPIQPDFFGIAIDTQVHEKVKFNQETGEVILYS